MIPPAAIPSLVSQRRLGAALHAHRSSVDATAAALSRQCDGWWGPDDLMEVERGAWPLDDAAIVSLCHLYGLPGRGLPTPDGLELVIDRSDAVDLVDDDRSRPRAAGELGLIRLAAVSQLLGVAPVSSEGALEVLSLAFDMSVDEIQSSLARLAGPIHDTVAEVGAVLIDRVAVPTVGLLIAATPSGSLVLARRAGSPRRPGGERLAAAGPLRWFTAPATSPASPA